MRGSKKENPEKRKARRVYCEGVLTVAPDKEGYRVRKQYEKRSADLGEVKPDSGGGRQVYRDWRKQTQRDIRCKGLQICALGWQ